MEYSNNILFNVKGVTYSYKDVFSISRPHYHSIVKHNICRLIFRIGVTFHNQHAIFIEIIEPYEVLIFKTHDYEDMKEELKVMEQTEAFKLVSIIADMKHFEMVNNWNNFLQK